MAKGLGMGLDALFGDSFDTENAEKEAAFLPIERIEPRADQPRSHFDADGLSELAGSIAEHGIIQPLTVRKLDGGYYQIIAGERRWRAARMAGLSEVPVRIIEADDKEAMEMALVENLQREDLNPVEEAAGYKKLMTEYGMTQEQVAARVGKSRPVIANALRILSLPKEALWLVETGALSLSLARTVLEAEGDDMRIYVAQQAAEKDMTVKQLSALIKKLSREEKPQKGKTSGVDYVAEVERDLTQKLGRKVKIVTGRKKGRFEIEYYGDEDFERLLAALENIKER